jgi:phosphate regulon transcriptional regulator PhoB
MTDSTRILVIDDEPDIVELVRYNLSREGYAVSAARDGEEALQTIRAGEFALIILDLMLPGIQGMELCRMLKKNPGTENIPIIMLTAKVEEVDRILGLESGADDYITKPFSPRELVARVKAVLRRANPRTATDNIVTIGDLVVDRQTFSVIKNNRLLDLSATELKLLLYLIEKRGRVFNREQLLAAVWKNDAYVEPRTVDVHIRRLRTQIEDDPSNPVYIKTKRGLGYYMDAQSSAGESSPDRND